MPVSFASASFTVKEAEGKNSAGAATQLGFFDRSFGGRHGAPVAKAKKGDMYQASRQCSFSCIPDTLVFLLWIPDFASGRRPRPEMGVDFDQRFFKKN